MKNRIKELRQSRKITQVELAKYLNVSQGTLSFWEQEKYEPDTKSLKKLAEYFGVSIDYLLGGQEKKPIDIDALLKQAEQANANMTVIIGQGMERKIVHVPPEAEAIIKSAIDAFEKSNKNNQ